jgi:hypothetical protein
VRPQELHRVHADDLRETLICENSIGGRVGCVMVELWATSRGSAFDSILNPEQIPLVAVRL